MFVPIKEIVNILTEIIRIYGDARFGGGLLSLGIVLLALHSNTALFYRLYIVDFTTMRRGVKFISRLFILGFLLASAVACGSGTLSYVDTTGTGTTTSTNSFTSTIHTTGTSTNTGTTTTTSTGTTTGASTGTSTSSSTATVTTTTTGTATDTLTIAESATIAVSISVTVTTTSSSTGSTTATTTTTSTSTATTTTTTSTSTGTSTVPGTLTTTGSSTGTTTSTSITTAFTTATTTATGTDTATVTVTNAVSPAVSNAISVAVTATIVSPTNPVFGPTKLLTGGITYNQNPAATNKLGVTITGSGTLFTKEIQIGDQITDSNGILWTVLKINSDTWLKATSTMAVNQNVAVGIPASVTLREGYYKAATPIGANYSTLTGSVRVPSTYVNDVASGNVLVLNGNTYAVSAVGMTAASCGLGSGLVIDLQAATTTLTGSSVTGGGSLGLGYPCGSTLLCDVNDPLEVIGSIDDDGLVRATAGGVGSETAVASITTVLAGGNTHVGAHYNSAATSLSTQHRNTLGSGAIITLETGKTVITSTVLAASSNTIGATLGTAGAVVGNVAGNGASITGFGYQIGDLLVVNNTTTATTPALATARNGLVQVVALNSAAGDLVNADVALIDPGFGFPSGAAALTTTNLGSWLNVAALGGINNAATANTTGITVAVPMGTATGCTSGAACPVNTINLGPVGTAVTFQASATKAYFVSAGSSGLIAGDILTVANANVGTVTGAVSGTILVTQINPGSHLLEAGTILTSGSNYPNPVDTALTASPYLAAAAKTSFPLITIPKLSAADLTYLTTGGAAGTSKVPTAGSNTVKVVTTDIRKQ